MRWKLAINTLFIDFVLFSTIDTLAVTLEPDADQSPENLVSNSRNDSSR